MTESQAEPGPNLLTVICTTYNHASYIGRTLEGFVQQRTDFRFVVLIGDDASTDGTADLVRQYAEKYPDRLQAVLRDRNLGPGNNTLDLFRRVNSKYLALCEGDDYWTDSGKLQKQVDFLEAHPGYSLCFHPVAVLNEPERTVSGIFPDAATRFDRLSLTLNDLLKRNFIQTNAVVYRWRFAQDDPDLAIITSNELQPGDYALHLMHAEVGKIGCLDEVMGVYCRHSGSMWTGAGVRDEWFLKWGLALLNFHAFKEIRFNYSQPQMMLTTAARIILAALRAGDLALIERLAAVHPGWYEKAVAGLATFGEVVKNDGMWREGLKFVLHRCLFLSKITWGRRKQHYLRKVDEVRCQLKYLNTLEDDR